MTNKPVISELVTQLNESLKEIRPRVVRYNPSRLERFTDWANANTPRLLIVCSITGGVTATLLYTTLTMIGRALAGTP